ncbi:response regulator [Echinicola salinicaeni]|uniref:response regulator n=1 Tax=Echinicola salinicaeni TaxID=2762757 RepID=UPI0016497339|nr:response regulator [Echinicola salinicaeni]
MGHKILLIEDHTEMAENISSILEFAQYQVQVAKDGKEGVEMAKNFVPDLILCDIMMPELDGYSVLHILSHDSKTADIPFIFLTAKADKKDFREGMNLGADDYISKPFEGLDLLKVVEMRLKKRKSLLEFESNTKHESKPEKEEASKGPALNLEDFSSKLQTRKFRRKDLIYMEGQNPNVLFQIRKGHVKTFKINSFGKELITGFHKPGDFLGYVALLESGSYVENAEALEELELNIISKDDFLTMVYGNKETAQRFFKLLSTRIDELEKRLLEIAYHSVRQRVASVLLKLSLKETGSIVESVIKIARKDIANLVGTTTETLNRTLADFKDEKLIDISLEGLEVLEREKLIRIQYH